MQIKDQADSIAKGHLVMNDGVMQLYTHTHIDDEKRIAT